MQDEKKQFVFENIFLTFIFLVGLLLMIYTRFADFGIILAFIYIVLLIVIGILKKKDKWYKRKNFTKRDNKRIANLIIINFITFVLEGNGYMNHDLYIAIIVLSFIYNSMANHYGEFIEDKSN